MRYSGAGGKLIHEKNQKQKISWHCPFKGLQSWTNTFCMCAEVVKIASSWKVFASVLELLNMLWGQAMGWPPGNIGWRNRFLGIDSWAN